jgi:hypothetical protein
MSTNAKNIGIARPLEQNARKRIAKSTASFLSNPNSTMNSFFNFGTISARKCQTYDLSGCVIKGNNADQKKRNQSVLEASVGQMDRLNRLKANNRSKENNSC